MANVDATTTIEIHGGVTGTLWMPAITGWVGGLSERYTLRRDAGPWERRVESLREALEDFAQRHDGDFQTSSKLTGDTTITIKGTRGNRTVSRLYGVERFANALADLVDFDVYSYDGQEGD